MIIYLSFKKKASQDTLITRSCSTKLCTLKDVRSWITWVKFLRIKICWRRSSTIKMMYWTGHCHLQHFKKKCSLLSYWRTENCSKWHQSLAFLKQIPKDNHHWIHDDSRRRLKKISSVIVFVIYSRLELRSEFHLVVNF